MIDADGAAQLVERAETTSDEQEGDAVKQDRDDEADRIDEDELDVAEMKVDGATTEVEADAELKDTEGSGPRPRFRAREDDSAGDAGTLRFVACFRRR